MNIHRINKFVIFVGIVAHAALLTSLSSWNVALTHIAIEVVFRGLEEVTKHIVCNYPPAISFPLITVILH